MPKVLLIFVIALCLHSGSAFAQRNYQIDHIGENYYARIFVADTSRMLSKGWIGIFDADTHKALIKDYVDDLDLYWRVLRDRRSLIPAAEDMIVMVDINFDGVEDFAIYNGRYGNFGEASFDVFLGNIVEKQVPDSSAVKPDAGGDSLPDTATLITVKEINFRYDKELSSIMQQSGRLYDVDQSQRTITFISKVKPNSLIYLLSTYEYLNQGPYLIKKEEYRP